MVSLLILWFLRVRVRLGDLALCSGCWVSVAVNDAGVFHRWRWNSTIVTISSKLDMLTFDRRWERFCLRSGYLRSFFKNLGHAVYKNLGQTRTPHAVSKVKHSSSFIPVKVLPSPLGAMVLYCYHTATYYSANLYRVVDLIKTDLYFKTRHFILFYFTPSGVLHGIVSPYIIGVTVIILFMFMLQYRCWLAR